MKYNFTNYLEKNHEYYQIVKPILEDKNFQKRKNFMHHENRSVYDHCLAISIISYYWAKKFNLDYRSAAIGGLLHDFYPNPWLSHNNKLVNKPKTPLFQKHGFIHAREAAQNAKKYYPDFVNEKIDNIIKRHMFPLNIHPPKYKESWLITIVDKYVSMEIFKNPTHILKYVGINFKNKGGK